MVSALAVTGVVLVAQSRNGMRGGRFIAAQDSCEAPQSQKDRFDPDSLDGRKRSDSDRADSGEVHRASEATHGARVSIRFLDHALANISRAGDGSTYLLTDSPGPHFKVTLVWDDAKPLSQVPWDELFEVSCLDRNERLHPLLGPIPARGRNEVGHDAQAAECPKNALTFYFDIAGLGALAPSRGPEVSGYVHVKSESGVVQQEFVPAFRLQDPWISFGLSGRERRWTVTASALLIEVPGIRSVSIRLFRGTGELPTQFRDVRIGSERIEAVLGRDQLIGKETLSATSDGMEEWDRAMDIFAIFEIETMKGTRHLATWRSTEREDR